MNWVIGILDVSFLPLDLSLFRTSYLFYLFIFLHLFSWLFLLFLLLLIFLLFGIALSSHVGVSSAFFRLVYGVGVEITDGRWSPGLIDTRTCQAIDDVLVLGLAFRIPGYPEMSYGSLFSAVALPVRLSLSRFLAAFVLLVASCFLSFLASLSGLPQEEES